jgi:hypothetical protein
MSINRVAPQWAIPGIGALRPRYDAVRIVSTATVGALKSLLPVPDLEKASHKFSIVAYRGRYPGLRSEIRVTGTDDLSPWQIMAKHGHLLADYKIVQVEVAFDVRSRARPRDGNDLGQTAADDARSKLFALVGMLAKPRHYRRYLVSFHEPDHDPGPGHLAEPTFYFEDRASSVALKCYCRYSKLPGGRFGAPCVRLEWTLKYKSAINRYLAGNQTSGFRLKDLLQADLGKFAETNLRLEMVDHAAVGKLMRGAIVGMKRKPNLTAIKTVRQRFQDPAYRLERSAYLVLRDFAHRQEGRLGDWQHALMVCQNSPAHIRGFLRSLKSKTPKLGRPKKRIRRRAISNHRINACFQPVPLRPVG